MLIVLKLLSNVNIPYAWQNVESCDRTCRTGSRKKTRTKTVEAAYGGSCSGDASVVEDCNTIFLKIMLTSVINLEQIIGID